MSTLGHLHSCYIMFLLQANLKHTVIGESPVVYTTTFLYTEAARHHTSSIPSVYSNAVSFIMPQSLSEVIQMQQFYVPSSVEDGEEQGKAT